MSSSPNPFADEPLPNSQRLQSQADPLNPYAAPPSAVEYEVDMAPGIGVWREGNYVVIHEQANFPARCLFTNEPEVTRQQQAITWSYPIDWTIRKVTFAYGFSESGMRRFRQQRFIAFGVSGISFVLLVALSMSSVLNRGQLSWLLFTLVTLVIVSLKIGWDSSSPLAFHGVKQKYFWLKGAKAPFLDSLPAWPGLSHQR